MIYQNKHGFFIFPFKAEWNINENVKSQYLTNKEEFEQNLLRYMERKQKIENERLKMNNENPIDTPVELPVITYTDIALTTEQQTRFDEVKNIIGLTLDDVKKYTLYNIKPSHPNYNLIKVNNENLSTMSYLIDVDYRLSLIEMGF